MYSEQEREDMKPDLERLIDWLEVNDHLKDTEEYKTTEEAAQSIYEIIHGL